MAVTFSLSRDIGTCEYPSGHDKYQSQHDDECDENPSVAQALFGLRLKVTASLDLTRALIVLGEVPPTSSSTPMGTELGSKSGMKRKTLITSLNHILTEGIGQFARSA
ncbi:MAG TPA: hypothetical protein VEK84_10960 [Terriglobales bacterium]|nr:hypothetical protein [Terriglobales bacterium]